MTIFKKRISTFIFLIAISILSIIAITNKSSYANQTYYLDDLKIGDFLEPNSTIIINFDYHGYSGGGDGYTKKVYFDYCLSYDNCISLNRETAMINENYTVSSLPEDLINTKAIGWEVDDIYGSHISLIPVTSYSLFTTLPSSENDYTVAAQIKNSQVGNYMWYLVSEPKYNITTNMGELLIENDKETYFQDIGTFITNSTYTIEYNLEAEKDDIISFDVKTWMGYAKILSTLNSITLTVDGINFDIEDNRTCQSYCHQKNELYETFRYRVTESGTHTILVTFNTANTDTTNKYFSSYFHLKNLKILKLINIGSKLDTTNLSNNTNVYYEAIGLNGYILSNELTYTKEEIKEPENPDTGSFINISLIIILILSIFILSIKNKRRLT